MKKFIAAVAVALCSLTANAQVWVGGSLGFSSVNPDGPAQSTTVVTIAPQFQIPRSWHPQVHRVNT